jgi:hypothetical protein
MAASPAEGLGGKLSESWAAAVLTPAFMFWAGGLAGAIWARSGVSGWRAVIDSLSRQASVTQIALLVLGLIVVTVSGLVVQAVTLPFIRWLEGYWPEWFGLRERLSRCRGPSKADEDRWQQLAELVERKAASDSQVRDFIVLDLRLRRIPNEPALRMPTRLGNVLSAAENWPRAKYGLDAPTCWPRLWLLLPDSTRKELATARAGVDGAVGACIWGLLFVAWTPWTWWAAPVGLIVAYLAYRRAAQLAEGYGDLVEAAFDVHRGSLYEALRWPRPDGPDDEPEAGVELVEYLRRGTAPADLKFTEDPPERDTTRPEPGS